MIDKVVEFEQKIYKTHYYFAVIT